MADDAISSGTCTHVSFSDLVLAGKFEKILKQLSPYSGFIVDSRGKELDLGFIKKTLETAEDGRAEDAFSLLLKAQSVPNNVLKLALETGPPVKKYAVLAVDAFKGLKQKAHGLRLDLILDCLDEQPDDFKKAVEALKFQCPSDALCKTPLPTDLYTRTSKTRHVHCIYTGVDEIVHSYDLYKHPVPADRTRCDVDTCAALLTAFKPKSLEELATLERWHAILHRVRNDLVDESTSKNVLKAVYESAGRAGKFGIQLEFAYYFPDIFAPQPAARRADLELLSNAMARVFLDGHEASNRSLKAEIFSDVKKLIDGYQAKMAAEMKVLETQVGPIIELHKSSLETINKLEAEVDEVKSTQKVNQQTLQEACTRLGTLETRIEAIRAEFIAGAKREDGDQAGEGDAGEEEPRDVEAVVGEYLHQMAADNEVKLEQRLEKQKSGMIGYIDGKIEGQASLLASKISALERDVGRLKLEIEALVA